MVTLENKKILINGKPTLILAGEVHYYRQSRKNWEPILDELKAYGANAVATYIPWICHEAKEGDFDLVGKYHEENDITYFMELVHKKGFYFIPRPGPFVMAEMKNEGIPYWVAKKHPEIVPTTWNGEIAPNPTLDYLHPAFLAETKKWYAQIMSLISKYSLDKGGNVIAMQLDNEIGMLSWVANAPDLTDFNLGLFTGWLKNNYSKAEADKRYGFDIGNKTVAFKNFRAPSEDKVLILHKDLGYFMRWRIKEYVAELKKYAIEYGVRDIPYIVNIHGCGGNRAYGYPIGISQLFESYNYDDTLMSGADYYLGELKLGTAQDLYMANAFTDCVNSPNQPLGALEFPAGDDNYGNNFNERNSPQSNRMRTKMTVAQGCKLTNYYTFSGGHNYRLDEKPNDGNDRISCTGEMHGYAAPVDGFLRRTTVFDMMAETNKVLNASADVLATSHEEHDNVVMSFIPDYFMIEYHYPTSAKNKNMINSLKRIVQGEMWGLLGRSLLLLNYRYPALDIQHNDITSSLKKGTVLALATALYMSPEIQENVVKFLSSGGNAFIFGELPLYDMEGNPCTILADYLGAKNIKEAYRPSWRYLLSAYPCGILDGHEEVRVDHAQVCDVDDADVFMRIYGTDEITGFRKKTRGGGMAVCLLNGYKCHPDAMEKLFNAVGAKAAFSQDYYWDGIFVTSTINEKKERFVFVTNLDCVDKIANISESGEVLFEKLLLKNRESLMLPVNVEVIDGVKVVKSTAEILDKSADSITFRLTQHFDRIVLETDKQIIPSDEFEVVIEDNEKIIKVYSKARLSDYLEVKFK